MYAHYKPTSFFSIRSPEQYLVKTKDHTAAHYAVSSSLLPRPSEAQISHPLHRYLSQS